MTLSPSLTFIGLSCGVSSKSLVPLSSRPLAKAELVMLILAGRNPVKAGQTADSKVANATVEARILKWDFGSLAAVHAGIMAVDIKLSPL
ncbi:hypothetical protein F5X98DRAFT_386207 [Xylaria grammica]|nr:hypothetical protein F5X98DRAFT_386207 [Xylaria grammica]